MFAPIVGTDGVPVPERSRTIWVTCRTAGSRLGPRWLQSVLNPFRLRPRYTVNTGPKHSVWLSMFCYGTFFPVDTSRLVLAATVNPAAANTSPAGCLHNSTLLLLFVSCSPVAQRFSFEFIQKCIVWLINSFQEEVLRLGGFICREV